MKHWTTETFFTQEYTIEDSSLPFNHGDDKKYTCKVCGYSFIESGFHNCDISYILERANLQMLQHIADFHFIKETGKMVFPD